MSSLQIADLSWLPERTADSHESSSRLTCGLDAYMMNAEMPVRRLGKGDVLFRQGEVPRAMFVVSAGQLNLASRAADGSRLRLAIAGRGELVGASSLLGDQPRLATAYAPKDALAWRIGSDDLQLLIMRRPALSLVLARCLAARLRREEDLVISMSYSDVPSRVAFVLLDLLQRFGRPAGEGYLIDAMMTQSDLGHLAGTSRESVNKVISAFQDRGWVRRQNRALIVLEPRRLSGRIR